MTTSGQERPFLSIVVPVFNEHENLEPLVREVEELLASSGWTAELILVDDGSRDGGWDRIRDLGRDRPWLRGLRFLGNQGQTAAMAAGIEHARGELIAFLDADLQNDPRDIPKMVAEILAGRADVVCGWRAHRNDRTFSRVLPSLVANFLITHALGLHLHDVGCTLKVFRRVYLEDVALYGEMHRFIPAYCAAQGGRIVEMEVNHRPRLHGTSKYGLSRVYKVLIDLLTVKMLNTYGSKPAYFFGKLGFVFFGLGVASFLLVAYRALVRGHPESTPMIFFMLLSFVASLVCVTAGLLAEINIRVLHRVGGQRSYRIVDVVGASGPAPGPGRLG
jgi:glycosyltransferase involved in cell wall biosynthesis